MDKAKRLQEMIEKGRSGKWGLFKLNMMLAWLIPFNKPHGIRVKEIGDDYVITGIPFKRKNRNHIRGIHACAIATISEFATGLLLLRKLDPARYRIIMSEMKMTYHYQAKTDLVARAQLSDGELQKNFIVPLEESAQISRTVRAEVHDKKGNHVATAEITWQLKSWEKVKTQL